MSKSKSKIKSKSKSEMETKKTICFYCKEHRVDPRNKLLFDGYLDKDMNREVCWLCHKDHRIEKSKTEFAGMYTDFPLYAEKRNYGNTTGRQGKSKADKKSA